MRRIAAQPQAGRLADDQTEIARSSIEDRVRRLENAPLAGAKILRAISLEDGIQTAIPHGMGRKVRPYLSPPATPSATGRIEDQTGLSSDYPPSQYIILEANGFGATILVDAILVPM